MIFETIEEFAAALPPNGALMGLDLGTKTIGVALSDARRNVASAKLTVKRKKFGIDAAQLQDIIMQNAVCGVILGFPRNMDGTEGPRCQSTRAFARNFDPLCGLPIGYWDERLSSVAAERVLLAADTTRKRRAEVIDNVAAAFILQGVLDRFAAIGAA